eukprot:jgi/Chrzof1/13677/Cz08g07210.t1
MTMYRTVQPVWQRLSSIHEAKLKELQERVAVETTCLTALIAKEADEIASLVAGQASVAVVDSCQARKHELDPILEEADDDAEQVPAPARGRRRKAATAAESASTKRHRLGTRAAATTAAIEQNPTDLPEPSGEPSQSVTVICERDDVLDISSAPVLHQLVPVAAARATRRTRLGQQAVTAPAKPTTRATRSRKKPATADLAAITEEPEEPQDVADNGSGKVEEIAAGSNDNSIVGCGTVVADEIGKADIAMELQPASNASLAVVCSSGNGTETAQLHPISDSVEAEHAGAATAHEHGGYVSAARATASQQQQQHQHQQADCSPNSLQPTGVTSSVPQQDTAQSVGACSDEEAVPGTCNEADAQVAVHESSCKLNSAPANTSVAAATTAATPGRWLAAPPSATKAASSVKRQQTQGKASLPQATPGSLLKPNNHYQDANTPCLGGAKARAASIVMPCSVQPDTAHRSQQSLSFGQALQPPMGSSPAEVDFKSTAKTRPSDCIQLAAMPSAVQATPVLHFFRNSTISRPTHNSPAPWCTDEKHSLDAEHNTVCSFAEPAAVDAQQQDVVLQLDADVPTLINQGHADISTAVDITTTDETEVDAALPVEPHNAPDTELLPASPVTCVAASTPGNTIQHVSRAESTAQLSCLAATPERRLTRSTVKFAVEHATPSGRLVGGPVVQDTGVKTALSKQLLINAACPGADSLQDAPVTSTASQNEAELRVSNSVGEHSDGSGTHAADTMDIQPGAEAACSDCTGNVAVEAPPSKGEGKTQQQADTQPAKSNLVSSIRSFLPATQQKKTSPQIAAGKAKAKVKALEAAAAARAAEEAKQAERAKLKAAKTAGKHGQPQTAALTTNMNVADAAAPHKPRPAGADRLPEVADSVAATPAGAAAVSKVAAIEQILSDKVGSGGAVRVPVAVKVTEELKKPLDKDAAKRKAEKDADAAKRLMDKQEREDRMRRAEAKRKEDEAKRKADLEEKQRAKEERTKKQMAAAQQKIATAAAAASNGLTGTARLELDKGKPVNNPISSKVETSEAAGNVHVHVPLGSTNMAAGNLAVSTAKTPGTHVPRPVVHCTPVANANHESESTTLTIKMLAPVHNLPPRSAQHQSSHSVQRSHGVEGATGTQTMLPDSAKTPAAAVCDQDKHNIEMLKNSPYVTAGSKRTPKVPMQPQGYEISPYRDDDAETPDRCGKSIPDWARSHNLLEALKKQQYVDPDKIFKAKNNTCALDDVFVDSEPAPANVVAKGRKRDFNKRGSSGDWTNDKITWQEEITYKKSMGYL